MSRIQRKKVKPTKEMEQLRQAMTDTRHDPDGALRLIKQALANPIKPIDPIIYYQFRIGSPRFRSPLQGERASPRGMIRRLPDTVVKTSETTHTIKGFYREGQTSGLPSKESPLARDLRIAEDRYLRQYIDVARSVREQLGLKNPAKISAGQASGASPKRQSKKDNILSDQRATHLVAKSLGVSRSYVRAIRSAQKKTGMS